MIYMVIKLQFQIKRTSDLESSIISSILVRQKGIWYNVLLHMKDSNLLILF